MPGDRGVCGCEEGGGEGSAAQGSIPSVSLKSDRL